MSPTTKKRAGLTNIGDLPQKPAVYALYGGKGRSLHVAYVGIAGRLRGRIIQHLVYRDSSVATGTSAAGLNPDHVTQLRWWEHKRFRKREVLEAAELVATEVLNPALRSRGKTTERARKLYAGPVFRKEMRDLFEDEPAGLLVVPTIQDALALLSRQERRIAELGKRVAALEKRRRR